MSNRVPESVISNFLTQHTTPLSLCTLSPISLHCSICHNPYAERNPQYTHPIIAADTPEYPVQVTNRGPCDHIFGRLCIESHIRSRQPWSHTCPLCRAEWFPAPHYARTELLGNTERGLSLLALIANVEEDVRVKLLELERLLERTREVLLGSRWL